LVTNSREARAGTNQRTRTYRCSKQPGEQNGCGRVVVTADPVEEIVEAYAQARLDDPAVQARVAELSAQTAANLTEINDLENRLLELEKQLDEPGVPVQAILRAMDRTRERIGTLAETAIPHQPRRKGGEWPVDLERRAALIRTVVARVVIHPSPKNTGGRFKAERVEIVPR
jgi:hypothetical protein